LGRALCACGRIVLSPWWRCLPVPCFSHFFVDELGPSVWTSTFFLILSHTFDFRKVWLFKNLDIIYNIFWEANGMLMLLANISLPMFCYYALSWAVEGTFTGRYWPHAI
jgi:hypothetical protein